MTWHIDPALLAVLQKINNFLIRRHIEAFLVGGFVRDGLLGRSSADIDIAVKSEALSLSEQIAADLGGTAVLLDHENQIARVVLSNYVPANPGAESNPDMSEASSVQLYIDLSKIEHDILHDLQRRDFTIDAMAVGLEDFLKNPDSFQVVDPLGGRQSLHERQITVTGESVFKADPLRLLRAFRLSSSLGFEISDATIELIRRDKDLISGVAGERVRDELLGIFTADRTGATLEKMDTLGLLTAIIPELESCRGVEQPKEHHWDVLHHSLKTVSALEFLLRRGDWEYAPAAVRDDLPWSDDLAQHFKRPVSHGSNHSSVTKLAALLHDIAKPETKIINAGRVRFFGHTEKGAETAAKILTRLRFTLKETGRVELMVSNHLRPTQMTHEDLPSRKAIYRFFRDTGESGIDILFLCLADHLAARGPDFDLTNWRWHTRQTLHILAEYLAHKEIVVPPRLIDGHDLIRLFALKPGPQIGALLEAVKEAQANGEVRTRGDALSYVKNRVL